ncbi:MAG: DUF6502 family protein [Xanthomonadales bacterium]|nr:DUF6502 family protein [Xanthomonadales bacterium]
MATAVLHNTAAQSDSWLLACLEQVLRPIIRLFLSRRIAYPAFAEVAKRIYIELAQEDAAKHNPRQPVTVSELAIATGIDAKTISHRLRDREHDTTLPSLSPESAILEQWATSPTFQDINTGKPLKLPIRGQGLSFATLVRRTFRNVSYGHVLDTLLEVGNVRISEDGKSVELVNRWYKSSSKRLRELMEAACRCLEHFISTMNWNFSCADKGLDATFYQQEIYTLKLNPEKQKEFHQACLSLLREQTSNAIEVMEPLEDSVRTDEHLLAGVGYYYFEA